MQTTIYRTEKEMATQSTILAWTIPWTEEPGGVQSTGSQESDTTEQLNHRHHRYIYDGETVRVSCGGHGIAFSIP